MSVSPSRRGAAVLLGALLAAACGAPDRAVAPRPATAAVAAAATIEVGPGESIAGAVASAPAGATIRVRPGVYREAIVVSVPGITIAGMSGPGGARVVIENPGGARDGVFVGDAGDGFTLTDVTVRGFARFGVVLIAADDFRLARVVAEGNGAYGLYPIRSSRGVIEHCTASGSADAGIYVGSSNDVRVRHNTTFANVVGIEISNTARVEVFKNDVFDNTIGILATIVPGRAITTSTDLEIVHNRVVGNNRPNFAPPGDLVAVVPPGIGILVIGPDRVAVEKNDVEGHSFFGIGVVDEIVLAALGLPPEDFAAIETPSNAVRVRGNSLVGNGFAPPPELAGVFPGVDLLWDGTGTGNCWEKNRFASSAPVALPACR